MIKKLLSMAAMALIAVSANADTLDLSLADLGSGWGDATYDSATKTITYVGEWTGKGWWLGNVDYSKYDEVVVEFEPTDMSVKLVVEYCDANGTKLDVSSDAMSKSGETTVTCPLNEEYKSHVMQIYLQNSLAGKLTLTAAYLQNAEVIDTSKDVEIWKGTEELKSWNGALTIPCSDFITNKIATGDMIKVAFNTTGGSFKVIYVSQDWAWTDWPAFTSLPGVNTEYGTLYAEKDGFVEIPIDDAALKILKENRELKVQGDGITVTSVDIVRGINTGIADITIEDENAPVEYFNLQGVRVENPANGLYIRRQGNKVTKVIL